VRPDKVRGPERLGRGGAAAQSPAFVRGGSVPGARIDVAAAARSTDVAARRIRLPGVRQPRASLGCALPRRRGGRRGQRGSAAASIRFFIYFLFFSFFYLRFFIFYVNIFFSLKFFS